MKTIVTRTSAVVSTVAATCAAKIVLAQGNYGLDQASKDTGLLKGIDIPTVIGRVLGTVLGFTGTIFFVLVVWAGLLWMTAAGNEDQIKKAQNILKAAIVGLIIILSAYAITRFIGTTLQ